LMWLGIFVFVVALVAGTAGLPGLVVVMCICMAWGIGILVMYALNIVKPGSMAPRGSDVSTHKIDPNAPPTRWAVRPRPFGTFQKKLVICNLVGAIVTFLLVVITFFAWTVPTYQVWSRLSPQVMSPEFQPQTVAKGVNAVYVFEGMEQKMKFNSAMFQASQEWCGPHYSQPLTSDEEKKKSIYTSFIAKYNIDMSVYERTSYLDYTTVNDWFSRKISLVSRPVAQPTDDHVVVSPADARVIVFQVVPKDSDIWIKNEQFTIAKLMGSAPAEFDEGSMAIVRLAPQDYHRFHSPVGGFITSITNLAGPLNSVNADAMTSGNGAIYNQRVAVMFNSTYGPVGFVAIGATCVGSIAFTYKVGDYVEKGADIGYFQFGGSTVVVVFPKDSVHFDDDLLRHSELRVEALLRQGQRIGLLGPRPL